MIHVFEGSEMMVVEGKINVKAIGSVSKRGMSFFYKEL